MPNSVEKKFRLLSIYTALILQGLPQPSSHVGGTVLKLSDHLQIQVPVGRCYSVIGNCTSNNFLSPFGLLIGALVYSISASA